MAQVFSGNLRCTTPRPDVIEMGFAKSTSKNTGNGIRYLNTVPERKIGAMALASGLGKLARGRQ